MENPKKKRRIQIKKSEVSAQSAPKYTDPWSSTWKDDHGGSDDVVLVQVAGGDVQVGRMRMLVVDGVAEQAGLSGGVKALSEGQVAVAVPASESWYVPSLLVLLYVVQASHHQDTQPISGNGTFN